ncbi:hypothetical protein Tco_1144734 [Tanacetum coccineum]
MDNLAKQLNTEVLHEKDSKSTLSVIKVQFHKFLQSEVLKPSNHKGEHIRKIFKEYTQMEAHSFTDLIIQNMDSIEKCIVERALHNHEIQKRLKRLNDRMLQTQECEVQEAKAVDASLGDTENSGFVSDKGNAYSSENDCSKTGNDQISEKQSNISGNESSRSGNECSEKTNFGNDTDIRLSYDT